MITLMTVTTVITQVDAAGASTDTPRHLLESYDETTRIPLGRSFQLTFLHTPGSSTRIALIALITLNNPVDTLFLGHSPGSSCVVLSLRVPYSHDTHAGQAGEIDIRGDTGPSGSGRHLALFAGNVCIHVPRQSYLASFDDQVLIYTPLCE